MGWIEKLEQTIHYEEGMMLMYEVNSILMNRLTLET